MATTKISNDKLTIEISNHGAELQSIKNSTSGEEYLWCGDKKYWGRHSPVLFPIVGKVWDGHYRHNGKEYAISQHGFARDREFQPITEKQARTITGRENDTDIQIAGYVLHSDKESREKLPFDFALYIIYILTENHIEVNWQIENKTDGEMYFQIGAHPAFNYKQFDPSAEVQGYLRFDKSGSLTITQLENGGYASADKREIELEKDRIPIKRETFAGDALVIEQQVHRVELCDRDGAPYIEVDFDAPAVGLWSPAKEDYAPFVCIEPWYGRCDPSGYKGEFRDKPYINRLKKEEKFSSKYSITIK